MSRSRRGRVHPTPFRDDHWGDNPATPACPPPNPRDTAKSLFEAVACAFVATDDVPGVSAGGGPDQGGTTEVLHARHRLPRGTPARRCHLCLSRLPAASTCSISLVRSPARRKKRRRRHLLAGLPAVGIAAVIGGSKSFTAIGQWAADAGPEVLTVPGAARGAADESTFRRAFARAAHPSRGADCVMTVKANMPALQVHRRNLPVH